MKLEQHHKKHLLDAFLQCASISGGETRNTIVNELPTEIKNTINRHSSNRIDVFNIISRCMEYHDGLETLINTINIFEENSKSMEKVYNLVPLIFDFSSNFSNHRWRELLLLISDIFISEEDLKNIYYQSIPLHIDRINASYSIWNLIKHLSDIPLQNDNTLPLLIFIDKMAKSLQDQSLIDQLNQWIENVITDFTEHSPGIKIKLTPEKQNVNHHPIHLLIKLIPELKKQHASSKKLFKVDVYSWKTPDPKDIERIDFIETFNTIKTIKHKIDEMIVKKFYEDDEIQAIHFFLPYDYVHLDVDQWPMEEGRTIESKIGKEYKVFIRLNRQISKNGEFKIVAPKIIQNLKKKWPLVINKKISSNSNSIVWVCGRGAYDPRTLFEQFYYSEEAACLILTFLPKEKMDNIGLGHVIRDGAIPAALFFRRSADAVHDHECVKVEMSNIIEGKNFSGLPDLIHKVRMDAKNEDHMGNHLTFIWDDPEKSIPKVYCQAP
jgi:hypothetical protein